MKRVGTLKGAGGMPALVSGLFGTRAQDRARVTRKMFLSCSHVLPRMRQEKTNREQTG